MSYKVTVNTTSSPYKVDVTTGGEVKAKFYADQAAQSASEALASEQASALSESNAASSESSASASALSASASASSALSSANTATSQALIATTKASEASTSANNALASEQAAVASELDAETAATQATAARDEIVNKIDFTGAVEGDIFRVNSLGVAVKINETEFLKSKVPFEKSTAEIFSSPRIFAWDNVNRANTAVFGGAGNLDSGQAWLNLAGQNGNVADNTVRLATTIVQNAVLAFERNSFSSTGSLLCDFIWRGDNNTNMRFFIGKDADNGLCFRIGVFTNSVIARVAGVETVISSNSLPLDVSQANAFSILRISITLVRGGVSNKGYAVLHFKDLNHSLTVSGSTFDSLINSIFSVASDVKYIGLQTSTNVSIGAGITTLRCYNI